MQLIDESVMSIISVTLIVALAIYIALIRDYNGEMSEVHVVAEFMSLRQVDCDLSCPL